jgi:hypothetical protein
VWTCFENELRIPMKFLNTRVKGMCPGGRPRLRWEQDVRKDGTQKERRS